MPDSFFDHDWRPTATLPSVQMFVTYNQKRLRIPTNLTVQQSFRSVQNGQSRDLAEPPSATDSGSASDWFPVLRVGQKLPDGSMYENWRDFSKMDYSSLPSVPYPSEHPHFCDVRSLRAAFDAITDLPAAATFLLSCGIFTNQYQDPEEVAWPDLLATQQYFRRWRLLGYQPLLRELKTQPYFQYWSLLGYAPEDLDRKVLKNAPIGGRNPRTDKRTELFLENTILDRAANQTPWGGEIFYGAGWQLQGQDPFGQPQPAAYFDCFSAVQAIAASIVADLTAQVTWKECAFARCSTPQRIFQATRNDPNQIYCSRGCKEAAKQLRHRQAKQPIPISA